MVGVSTDRQQIFQVQSISEEITEAPLRSRRLRLPGGFFTGEGVCLLLLFLFYFFFTL